MAKQVSEGSLHKWFKGSKSKDGKGGWVNVVTGGTCASDEPGEGTPKCVSSAKRASMTKAERLSAARRKKKADPGQQSKSGAAKPTYVSTDSPRKKKKKKMNEGWSDKYKQSIDCDNPKGFSQKAHCQGKKKMKETYQRHLTPLTEKAKKCWPGYEKKGTKKMFGKTYNNCVKKEEVELSERLGGKGVSKKAAQSSIYPGSKGDGDYEDSDRGAGNRAARRSGKEVEKKSPTYLAHTKNKKKVDEELVVSEAKDKKGKGSGTKDACYHKVKSRYSVWPSAYASGALVKCRKVGAANWGNSSKKESFSDWKSEFIWEDGDSSKKIEESHYGKAVNKIPKELDKAVALHTSQAKRLRASDEFKKDAGKTANKIPGQLDKAVAMHTKQAKQLRDAGVGEKNCGCGKTPCKTYGKKKNVKEAISPVANNNIDTAPMRGTGSTTKTNTIKKLTPIKNSVSMIQNRDSSIKKMMDNTVMASHDLEGGNISETMHNWRAELGEDWQKTNRQDKTDGMSQKAVDAYKRENPGSKLKTAVTTKPSKLKKGSKSAKRRKSFCSRMKGMKKRLTSAKTARDPDSRINKALRRWNC